MGDAAGSLGGAIQGVGFGPFTPQSRLIRLDVSNGKSSAVSVPGGTYIAFHTLAEAVICSFNVESGVPTKNGVTSGFALLGHTGCIVQAPHGTTTLNARVDASGNVFGTVWLSAVE